MIICILQSAYNPKPNDTAGVHRTQTVFWDSTMIIWKGFCMQNTKRANKSIKYQAFQSNRNK
jgi:hypothetical protein